MRRAYVFSAGAGLLCMLLMDFIWLGLLMKGFYARELSAVVNETGAFPPFSWLAGVGVYTAMLGSILFFVLRPLPMRGAGRAAAAHGALLGGIIFAVYEGTNYVFIREWTLAVVIADIFWGCMLFGATSAIAYAARGLFSTKSKKPLAKSSPTRFYCVALALTLTQISIMSDTDPPTAPAPAPEQWVERFGDYLYRYALSRLREPTLAEDCVQNTFLAGIRKLDTFDRTQQEKFWLRGVMRNQIIDHYRKQARERTIDLGEDTALLESALYRYSGIASLFPQEWQFDPREQFDKAEFSMVFQQCVDELREPLREAFVLKMLEDISTPEVCEVMGVSSDYLWVLMHRAREELRVSLQKRWLHEGGSWRDVAV